MNQYDLLLQNKLCIRGGNCHNRVPETEWIAETQAQLNTVFIIANCGKMLCNN